MARIWVAALLVGACGGKIDSLDQLDSRASAGGTSGASAAQGGTASATGLLASLGSGPWGYGSVALSKDGRFVAYMAAYSAPGSFSEVFVRDIEQGTTERASVGPEGENPSGDSLLGLAISADGRFVAFVSEASNLVADDTNDVSDVFVRDREAGVTHRVSISSAGEQANAGVFWPERVSISDDGNVVSFTSSATNLVDEPGLSEAVFVHDRAAGTTERVPPAGANGSTGESALSPDGQRLAFGTTSSLVANDGDNSRDIYLYDRATDALSLESVETSGDPLPGYGEYPIWRGERLTFFGGKPQSLYTRDLQSGETELSVEDALAAYVASSADGSSLAYTTNENEIWLQREGQEPRRVVSGVELDTIDRLPHQLSLSGDGRWLAYCERQSCRLIELEP